MTLQKNRKAEGEPDGLVWKAALAAIVIGLAVTAYLVAETGSESYSALYLRPDSYSNYLNASGVSFIYGVQCFENAPADYDLKVYLGETLVTEKRFSIEGRGRTLEDTISFEVPAGLSFPAKVSLVLAANGKSYSVHYWLKGRI
jgi:hypothetical protein